MKRLIVILGLLLSTNAFAGTISIQPWISSNDVTIAHLETQRQTIQNVINGGIEGGQQNIRAGSITSSDLSASINPVVFRQEAFNNWTYSGMLPVTSANLNTTISAGVSYVSGVRVQSAITAHTYTASKDTYTYINAGGFFDYVEVANGAAIPSTPSNDLLLAKVVTSGTAVSSVTDLRTTSLQITATSSNTPSNYRDQAFLSRDSSTTFHFSPGSVAIGTTIYTTTANSTTKSVTSGTNWIEGNYPETTAVPKQILLYAYNNAGSTWDFKFSSADAAYYDTNSNVNGVLRYYVNAGTTYRCIGWMWVSADTVTSYNFSNFNDIGVMSYVQRTDQTANTIDDTSYGNDLQQTNVDFFASGLRQVQVTAQLSSNSNLDNSFQMVLNVDGTDETNSEVGMSTQVSGTGGIWMNYTIDNMARGHHVIKLRGKVAASNDTINKKVMIVREI